MKKLLSIISAFLFVFICAGCNAPKVECNSVVIQFSENSASGILSLEPAVTANGGFKCAAKISGDYNSVKSKTYSNISELNNEKKLSLIIFLQAVL